MRPAEHRESDFCVRCLQVNLRLLEAFHQEVVLARWSESTRFRHAKHSLRMPVRPEPWWRACASASIALASEGLSSRSFTSFVETNGEKDVRWFGLPVGL